MNTIILNSTHRVPNSNNKFVYRFPTQASFTSNDTIAVSTMNVFNSFFNIEATRGNNKISIFWAPDGLTYNLIIPDGFYDIPALNYQLQFFMTENHLYTYSAIENENVFYIELVLNPNRYAVELRCFPVPDSNEAATDLQLTKPVDATWDFHLTFDLTPSITFNSAFGSLIGFSAGTYPELLENEIKVYFNDLIPQISIVNSLLVTCNLVNSFYSNPVNVLYSMPISSSFGNSMSSKDSMRTDVNIFDGTYQSIVLEILDQRYERVHMHDFELEIKLTLIIAKK